MNCPTNIQILYVKCPANRDYAIAYQAPVHWFELINGENYLKLYINPEEYVTLREGEAPRPIRSFVIPRYPLKLRETGFVCTLAEDNIKLRFILEDIIEKSVSANKQHHSPIRVIDFVRPDRADYEQSLINSTNPFTVRDGFIDIEPGSGSSGMGSDRLGTNGIRFTFRQVKMQL